MKSPERFARAEALLQYTFSDKLLLERALTHPSAVEDLPVWHSYERLEFLGDSILGFVVADLLYECFADADEGELTQAKVALVSGKMLSQCALDLGLASLIIMGESERGTGARGMTSALENVFESLVGALYLDGGLDVARNFIHTHLAPHVHRSLTTQPLSPKSYLQEVLQKERHATPVYRLIHTEGPAHDPCFTSVVYCEDRPLGRGKGSSKKASESAAAEDALIRGGYIFSEDSNESSPAV